MDQVIFKIVKMYFISLLIYFFVIYIYIYIKEFILPYCKLLVFKVPNTSRCKKAKQHSKLFTHHIAKYVAWFFLEHLIEKLFDLFWYFILVKISHSFAFLLQAVGSVFYRHLESPGQLKLFTRASL